MPLAYDCWKGATRCEGSLVPIFVTSGNDFRRIPLGLISKTSSRRRPVVCPRSVLDQRDRVRAREKESERERE